MNKRVLLINPWIYDFSAYDYWIKPLGLLYMASYIRRNGINVEVIDCLNPENKYGIRDPHIMVPRRKTGGHGKFIKETIPSPSVYQDISKPYNRYGITPALFKELLQRAPKADLVIVTTMMTYWYPGAFDVIRMVKEDFPDTPVIIGGNYVTLCPEHARNSGADYMLAGPGERHMTLIVQDLLGSPLLYQPDVNDLDDLPYPAFDLLYKPDQVPILTSRGCPFRCPYCASHLLNRHFIRREPLKVLDEIIHWASSLGIEDFSFYDDALFTNPEEMAIPFMQEIIDRGLTFRFHCPNGIHLREVTAELARLMFQSGFKTLRFGFETSDLQRQKKLGGKADNTHLDTAVSCLREAGYCENEIGIYILCGLPGQSYAEIFETIRYVRKHGAKPILAEFSPIPQTDFWQAALESSPFPLDQEPLFHNNSLLPCRKGSITPLEYQELKSLTRTM